ncbi:MAG: polymerase sigma factor RpoD, partial [Verrucomicrobiota bacterium]
MKKPAPKPASKKPVPAKKAPAKVSKPSKPVKKAPAPKKTIPAKKPAPPKKSAPAKKPAPVKAPTKAPAKAPAKAPVKAPAKAPFKTPAKAPAKAPVKAPAKASIAAPAPAAAPSKSKSKGKSTAPATAIQTLPSDIPKLIQEKVRELIRLAKEQGYLTYEDLDEHLPEGVSNPDHLDAIISQLRGVEIEIIEASDVDRVKEVAKPEEEEEKEDKEEKEEKEEKADTKLDILDDPVRMYLKQMGQVPLLTREQEVEISKRIEDAELKVQEILYCFGSVARAHYDLGQKLIDQRERFDRVILDKKIESRDSYMKALPRLCQQLKRQSEAVSKLYHEASKVGPNSDKRKKFDKALKNLQALYPKFFYKQKVIEDFVILVEENRNSVGNLQRELAKSKKSSNKKLQKQHTDELREMQMRFWLSAEELSSEHDKLKLSHKHALKAKTEMVEANLRLVISIAKKYTNR